MNISFIDDCEGLCQPRDSWFFLQFVGVRNADHQCDTHCRQWRGMRTWERLLLVERNQDVGEEVERPLREGCQGVGVGGLLEGGMVSPGLEHGLPRKQSICHVSIILIQQATS